MLQIPATPGNCHQSTSPVRHWGLTWASHWWKVTHQPSLTRACTRSGQRQIFLIVSTTHKETIAAVQHRVLATTSGQELGQQQHSSYGW